MHTTQDRHRTKRHLKQPAITTFLAFDAADSDHETPRSARPKHQLLAPQLPPPVQTDLLQVGMRVRKSVPEGYKTHANKMLALPSIQTTINSTVPARVSEPVPELVVHQRELLPFCGLHKIGGFAEQPTDLYSSGEGREVWHLPAETFTQPFHSGSQDSGYESVRQSENTNPSKRSWHDEDDIRLHVGVSTFGWGKVAHVSVEEVPVSPLSENPEGMLPAVREIKMPKSRRRRDRDGDVAHRVAAGSGSDFEEADFLGTEEVVMGGM